MDSTNLEQLRGTVLPDSFYENLAPREKPLSQVEAEYGEGRTRDRQLQARWTLGLAVANGGALTALSAKALEVLSKPADGVAKAVVALIVPSMWLFVVGFLASGAIAALEIRKNQKEVKLAHRSLKAHAARSDIITLDVIESPGWKGWALEAFSAFCFLAGVVYPLLVLGLRYLQKGEFFW
jgi:hypothetical protein